MADHCRRLAPLALKLDRARGKLAAAESTDELRATFNEATRRAAAAPTTEALKRVQDATAALLKIEPARQRLEAAEREASQRFKAQLAIVMREAAAA